MRATLEAVDMPGNASRRVRAVDACRHAVHLSHEARLLKSLATDAVEDGVHRARRALRSLERRVENLATVKDEAVHRVRRQPLQAMGIALGAGLVLGLAVGWFGGRSERGGEREHVAW